MTVFLDKDQYRAGNTLNSSLMEVISNSKHFIFLATEDTAKSEWVKKEYSYYHAAIEQGKLITYHPVVFADPSEKIFQAFPRVKIEAYRKCYGSDKETYNSFFKELYKDISHYRIERGLEINNYCWLQYPSNNSHPTVAVSSLSNVSQRLDEKANLVSCLLTLTQNEANGLSTPDAMAMLKRLEALSESEDEELCKSALILQCIFLYEYAEFRKSHKRVIKKVHLQLKQYEITELDKEILSCFPDSRTGSGCCLFS